MGMKYTAANGKPIYNEGVKTLFCKTKEGQRKKINFEVADVNKPLASLRKIVKNGHRIVLDDDIPGGGHILHKASGKLIPLEKKGNTYELDLFIDMPPFTRPAK